METEDFAPGPEIKADPTVLGVRPPNGKSLSETILIDEAHLMPRCVKEHAESKVTWQEFVEWMRARNP